nr:uncharacterized protein LOC104104414 [Nicotiana tomentosiformis]
MAEAAVDFFQRQFTQEAEPTSFELLNNVPTMVSAEQNIELCTTPTREEVKATIFALSGESASGPDGFTDLRRIRLSNSINKVFSRVLHDRLEKTLPTLISTNQSGFVKGRSIFENILLTQEIVTNIRLRGKPDNVVIKLDMAKAYDRYLVLINSQASHFFHSTRGAKQGDPLSPALFILSTEVPSRSLNKLFEDKLFKGYSMPKWTDLLNHLAYVDDTIIFASPDQYFLQKIVEVLAKYEHISGQLINKEKCSFYVHSNTAATLINTVTDITGISKGEFPFTYLGCPIFYTRRRKEYYNELTQKVKAKLHSWKGKLLSYGGKATLISSVLQSMPFHILPILDPPANRNKDEGRSRHWTKWQNLCLPKDEGGVRFRSLVETAKALFAKLWWNFRTTKSLWANFTWNKCCKKEIPTVVQFKQRSHVWKKMLEAREEVGHELLWELKSGSSNIWHENWTGLGALYHVIPPKFHINEELQEVAELREENA